MRLDIMGLLAYESLKCQESNSLNLLTANVQIST